MTKCNRCGQEIVWEEKYDANATKRSPPNNKDGTPHRCNTGKTESTLDSGTVGFNQSHEKANPVNLADIDLPHETKVKVCDTCKNINKVLQVIEWQAWEDLGFDTSPARVGMYINNACKKLLNVPNLEEILADMGDKDASS